MSNPFDFIKSINQGKDIMTDAVEEHQYNAFLTNYSFSLFPDTLFEANDMNTHPQLSNKMQYKYYLSMVRPAKRFKEWPKKNKITGENIRLIQELYKYNTKKAKEVLRVLSENQLDELRKKLKEKGG